MCGFVGFADRKAEAEKEKILQRMMQRIVHRGPDMGNMYADESIGLGFQRLSIIDLSDAGLQPMTNEDGTVWVVFNGEIYNFAELREQLEEKGHIFKSNADTEVLVHGYEEWGEQVVAMLRGMFGFCVWDTKTKKMLAARDPFGIKPFYYYQTTEGDLLFGSEIKAFLEHPNFVKAVNPNALRAYLTFQSPMGEETFFDGVYSLPQGHYFVWDGHGVNPVCYYDVDFAADNALSFEDCVEEIDVAVHESVQAHAISDVPVGSFLSGGVDSSYITACLMPQKTFSVGFAQDNFNETNYAAELSEKLGIENHRLLLTADECFEAISDIQYHMDQPQSNPSSVPLWFLAKLAREHVTVVLSGEGADELFAGYELYADTPGMESFKKLPLFLRRALGAIADKLPEFKGRHFLMRCAEKPERWFIGQADVMPEKDAKKLLQPAYRGGKTPRQMTAPFYKRVENKAEVRKKQYIDLHLWLPGDILLKADKMCMAHSLELRVPFLDKKIMDVARRVPAEYCIRGSENKVVFRTAANRTLPDEWANRPKKGFPVPIRMWLREEKYYNIVKEAFSSDYAAVFFDQKQILTLLEDHYTGKKQNQRRIWTVYTFLVWYKRFFIDEAASA